MASTLVSIFEEAIFRGAISGSFCFSHNRSREERRISSRAARVEKWPEQDEG